MYPLPWALFDVDFRERWCVLKWKTPEVGGRLSQARATDPPSQTWPYITACWTAPRAGEPQTPPAALLHPLTDWWSLPHSHKLSPRLVYKSSHSSRTLKALTADTEGKKFKRECRKGAAFYKRLMQSEKTSVMRNNRALHTIKMCNTMYRTPHWARNCTLCEGKVSPVSPRLNTFKLLSLALTHFSSTNSSFTWVVYKHLVYTNIVGLLIRQKCEL